MEHIESAEYAPNLSTVRDEQRRKISWDSLSVSLSIQHSFEGDTEIRTEPLLYENIDCH